MTLFLPVIFACAFDRAGRDRVELIGPEQMRVRMFSAAPHARLYNFWATWCGPCKAELPLLRTWATNHPEIEVILVSLDLASHRDNRVEPFLHDNGIAHFTHWQIDDPDPARAAATIVPDWPDQIPVTLFVGDEGRIRRRFDRALIASDLAALP